MVLICIIECKYNICKESILLDTHLAAVVVEDCGDVFFGKSSGGVGNEQAGLPHSAISHHNTLYTLHDHL